MNSETSSKTTLKKSQCAQVVMLVLHIDSIKKILNVRRYKKSLYLRELNIPLI